MVNCPVCDGGIDVEEEDVDEGETLSCDECGANVKVLSKNPLELELADEVEDVAADDFDDEEDATEENEAEAEEEDEWK